MIWWQANNGSSFDGLDWTNPSYAQYSDTQYATVTVGGGPASNLLQATSFNLDIPSTATIVGIHVQMQCHSANGGRLGPDVAVLLYNGGRVGSAEEVDVGHGSCMWRTSDS